MPSHALPIPFRFERDFGLPFADDDDAATLPPSPPPPMFTEDDLHLARTEAYADGVDAGRREALAATAERTAAVLGRLADTLAGLGSELVPDPTRTTRDVGAVAMAVCRRLLPEAYRAAAVTAVGELVSLVLPRVALVPQLRLWVAPAIEAEISRSIAALPARLAFAGELTVAADQALAPGDCRIDWARGGVIRDLDQLWREVDRVMAETTGLDPVARPLSSPSGEAPPPEQRDAGHA